MLELLISIALILVGFILLVWSADMLVDNASILANRLGISTFIVGVVIIGFGTSAPEMFVSAMAALENKGNLALGNALGSNITNIGLVLGSAALISTLHVSKSTATKDIPIVILTGLLAVYLVSDGVLTAIDGYLLLGVLATYLIVSALTDKQADHSDEMPEDDVKKSTALYCLLTIVSIIILMAASKMLVIGSTDIARLMGVGELMIGLTIVAIGTSLPELAAAVAAARKGVHDMIIGNIVGSNIFNTLGVLGIMGAIQQTNIDTSVLGRDFPVMFAFTVLMLLFALTKRSYSRFAGTIMVIGYIAYVCYLIVSEIK